MDSAAVRSPWGWRRELRFDTKLVAHALPGSLGFAWFWVVYQTYWLPPDDGAYRQGLASLSDRVVMEVATMFALMVAAPVAFGIGRLFLRRCRLDHAMAIVDGSVAAAILFVTPLGPWLAVPAAFVALAASTFACHLARESTWLRAAD
jgi:hypothetical protein